MVHMIADMILLCLLFMCKVISQYTVYCVVLAVCDQEAEPENIL